MYRPSLRVLIIVASCTLWALVGTASTLAQSEMPSMPSCMVGVTAQPLAQAMPPDAGGDALVALSMTIAPAGGFGPHTHAGVVTVSVVSGSLEFTLLEADEMVIDRAPTDGGAATTDTVTPNQPITANTGDWFVEAGSVHEAWNRSDDPVTLIVAALVDPSQPFVRCVDMASPGAS